MKTVMTVVGARPQFIKAATVSRAMDRVPGIQEMLVHTGQHFDTNMAAVFFEELEIPTPPHNLGVSGGSHGAMTARMLTGLEAVMEAHRPDWVLVYGDTNSTLAGALAAVKLHISVAHVEAGLRSYNRAMPEEINRVLTDHAADLLLTPTDTATGNLLSEGMEAHKISQVGDVMFDAALFYGSKAETHSCILEENNLERSHYVMATVHRQENTDDPQRLEAIFQALQTLSTHVPVVLPLHPRTRKCLHEAGLMPLTTSLTLLPPVGYLDMVMLERAAAVIVTDSGGIQKEAYFHEVPCVILRDETEWIELIELGWNQLAPPESADIAGQILGAIGSRGGFATPYGEGHAAEAIVERLLGTL